MIQNFPEHKIDISKSISGDELVSSHVRIELLELWLQVVVTVRLTLFEWS